MFVKKGDLIQVVAINPDDLPDEHLSNFVGRIGEVIDFDYEEEEVRLLSVYLHFNDDNTREQFYPSSDILMLMNKEPDWRL